MNGKIAQKRLSKLLLWGVVILLLPACNFSPQPASSPVAENLATGDPAPPAEDPTVTATTEPDVTPTTVDPSPTETPPTAVDLEQTSQPPDTTATATPAAVGPSPTMPSPSIGNLQQPTTAPATTAAITPTNTRLPTAPSPTQDNRSSRFAGSCTIQPPPGWTTYLVREGDRLIPIAAERDSTVQELMRVNCRQTDVIVVGELLYVPDPTAPLENTESTQPAAQALAAADTLTPTPTELPPDPEQPEVMASPGDVTLTPTELPPAPEQPIAAATATATELPPEPEQPPSEPNLRIPPLRGDYFNNPNLEGEPILMREDGFISFDWGPGSPAAEINSDNFSVRWTGGAYLHEPGIYRFSVTSDDGVRLWINDMLVIDAWSDHTAMTFTHDMDLPEGFIGLRLEYYEGTKEAMVSAFWEKID